MSVIWEIVWDRACPSPLVLHAHLIFFSSFLYSSVSEPASAATAVPGHSDSTTCTTAAVPPRIIVPITPVSPPLTCSPITGTPVTDKDYIDVHLTSSHNFYTSIRKHCPRSRTLSCDSGYRFKVFSKIWKSFKSRPVRPVRLGSCDHAALANYDVINWSEVCHDGDVRDSTLTIDDAWGSPNLSPADTSLDREPEGRGRCWSAPTSQCDPIQGVNPLFSNGITSSMESCSLTTTPISSHSYHPYPPPTYVWKVKRNEFYNPMFRHTHVIMEKSFGVVSTSSGENLGLKFILKLYPNGIEWDWDTFATLKVEVKGVTPVSPGHGSRILYFHVKVIEEGQNPQILAYREHLSELKDQEFFLKEFVPHEVVKMSQAKTFSLLFTISIRYNVGEGEWQSIETSQ